MTAITLQKMPVTRLPDGMVSYQLAEISMNELIGATFSFTFLGKIHCTSCSKKTKKSFSGYCYNCFTKLAAADMCTVRPETCHFHKQTCRQPDWGIKNCFIQHTIYLANSSGLKVGITRSPGALNRWMDQGASQAIALGHVYNRLEAGLVEVALKKHVTDKTQWRKMLSGIPDPIDLVERREHLLQYIPTDVGFEAATSTQMAFTYPSISSPEKINSIDLEKTPEINGCLLGIKGQYLIFDTGVLNVRKHEGYLVEVAYDKSAIEAGKNPSRTQPALFD